MRLHHDWATRLRLISGLTMFTFVTTHLLNHSLGLVSLGLMQRTQYLFLEFWTSRPMAVVLGTALGTHLVLVSWKQIRRRSWRMPTVEVVRIVMGILVLFLLTAHALSNYVLFRVPGVDDSYSVYLLKMWPKMWLAQTTLVAAAWTHGCIGVHRWLRLRPGYRSLLPVLYPAAVLLPVAALLGVVVAAREAQALALDPAWLKALELETSDPTPEMAAWIEPWWRVAAWVTFGAAAGLLFVRSALLAWARRKHGVVRIRYAGGSVVEVVPGTTVLEASQIAGIPHASVCGGRGRCSTCRVQVLEGGQRQPAASYDEAQVLQRIKAPPGVRLACQLRPVADLTVVPLVPPNAGPAHARPQGRILFGQEMHIAIMFTDVRGFTKLSEHKLAYDVVHILNQYFEAMSEAIESNRGHVDKYIGDGIMALFGLNDGPGAGCRSALATARGMAERLEELNQRLAPDLQAPLRIGIGIHVGTAIVGEMGHKSSAALTAIGDAVNVASRLESMTKEHGCQLIVAEDVAKLAGVDLSAFPRSQVDVRGRTEPLTIFAVPSGLDLPNLAGIPVGGRPPADTRQAAGGPPVQT